MIAQLISAAIGVWLMIAPSVLDYAGTPANVDRIAGPLVASIATIALWECTRGVRRVNLVLGLLLIAASFWFHYPLAAAGNSVACGAAITLLSAIRSSVRSRFGGGWRALIGGHHAS